MKERKFNEWVVRVYDYHEEVPGYEGSRKAPVVEFYKSKDGKEFFTASYFKKTLTKDKDREQGLWLVFPENDKYLSAEIFREIAEWLDGV